MGMCWGHGDAAHTHVLLVRSGAGGALSAGAASSGAVFSRFAFSSEPISIVGISTLRCVIDTSLCEEQSPTFVFVNRRVRSRQIQTVKRWFWFGAVPQPVGRQPRQAKVLHYYQCQMIHSLLLIHFLHLLSSCSSGWMHYSLPIQYKQAQIKSSFAVDNINRSNQ